MEQLQSIPMNAAVSQTGEEVLLDHNFELTEGVPNITVTNRRVIRGVNSYSLEGVTDVKLEVRHLRGDNTMYSVGWVALIVGVPLIFVGFVGILVIVAGIYLIWTSGRSIFMTGQVFLERANGTRQLCYENNLLTNDAAALRRTSFDVETTSKKHHFRLQCAKEVAQAIGEAIARR